jgi:hypothetical protein
MLAGVVLATGCGGSSTASSGSTEPAAAVPAGALVYADVNLDHDSNAWKQFARRQALPGWQRLVDNAIHSFDDNPTGTTYEDDIEPWLGNPPALP